SSDPVEQRGWEAAGAAGDLTDRSLAVSLLNRGGNKLDWFASLDTSLEVKRVGADSLITATVHVTNETPAGAPGYLRGRGPGAGGKGEGRVGGSGGRPARFRGVVEGAGAQRTPKSHHQA